MAKENEVLKKTLEEREMIVNVLQGDREELRVMLIEDLTEYTF